MWAWEKFIFRGELMEEVYDVAELMLEGQPAHVNQLSVWLKDATIDPFVVSTNRTRPLPISWREKERTDLVAAGHYTLRHVQRTSS